MKKQEKVSVMRVCFNGDIWAQYFLISQGSKCDPHTADG